MNKYAGFIAEVHRMDSLRIYWLNPPDTTQAVAADSTVRDTTQRNAMALADSGKPKAPPKPPLPLDSVMTRLATAKSELASLFYTSIGRTDSALFWYHRIVQDHPLSPLVPRALFTIAQIYSQDSTVSKPAVDSLYHQIIEQYPQTLYAAEARRVLGLPPITATPDTAEALYRQAEQAMLSGRNENAIDTLKLLVQSYPTSTYAPRAEFAAGWLYEQVLNQPDSAIANYQRLRARYPSSLYAARVQPKLMEVELRDKAIADSLSRRSKAIADSVARKNNPVADSTMQKQNAAVGVQQKPVTDEAPLGKRRGAESPAGRDSTIPPRIQVPDTGQTQQALPPISKPEKRD